MRRLVLLLAVLAVCATGVWLALRGGNPAADANARVTSLLPAETLAFLHLPDFNRTREQWRETDIYKLWREPAVQEFLQKPLSRWSQTRGIEERLVELERLGIRDAFIAVPSWSNQRATVLGGFRFRASRADAEKVISEWRGKVQQRIGGAAETTQHRHHRIEVLRQGDTMVASVYDGDWFFAANDLPALTAILDRTDSRRNAAGTLADDARFAATLKQMPDNYAVFGYLRPDELAQRLDAQQRPGAVGASRHNAMRPVRSAAAASTFDNGKIRDVIFAAVPKRAENALTRESLVLGTSDTFLFLAALLKLPDEMAIPQHPAPVPGSGLSAALQPIAAAIAQAGISRADWADAFGAELGVIGDWPATARIPALLATLPVKDAAKADRIIMTITAAAAEGSRWAASDRDGVRYYSQVAANPLIPLSPTVGIGHERMILGLDTASVEAAMKRAENGAPSGLRAATTYRAAEAAVQEPTESLGYVDTALLYRKLDAALRPMLIMGAAFMPSIAEAVDLMKVPPAEVITRHLSPIMMSQTYVDDGYRAESVGPLSIFQAAVSIAAVSGAGADWYWQNAAPRAAGTAAAQPPDAAPSPSGTP